jgi:hypothetical protein
VFFARENPYLTTSSQFVDGLVKDADGNESIAVSKDVEASTILEKGNVANSSN